MAAYAFDARVLDGFLAAPPPQGALRDAADEHREICCHAAEERWSPRSPQFLRQTLTDRPPYRTTVLDPQPLDDAWALLCQTFGAVGPPQRDLPWWLEPFAPDAFVRITPPSGLRHLVTVISATDLLARTLPLLPMMDCHGFEEDLSSMFAFIERTASADRTLVVFHWTS
jgi:hypothetical protein